MSPLDDNGASNLLGCSVRQLVRLIERSREASIDPPCWNVGLGVRASRRWPLDETAIRTWAKEVSQWRLVGAANDGKSKSEDSTARRGAAHATRNGKAKPSSGRCATASCAASSGSIRDGVVDLLPPSRSAR
jgi:hypothetical protein